MRIEVELPEAAVAGQYGVYVVFDGDDDVLYIGRTKDLYARMRGHRSQSAWFRQMRRVEFTPCDGLTEARAVEKSLISAFRPDANVNDFSPQQRSSRQRLPEWTVARLTWMFEAASESFTKDCPENDALNNYIAALRQAGWTLAAIGEGMGVTREAVRLRQLRATRIDTHSHIPAVPVRIKPTKKPRPVIPPTTLALLLELKAQAMQVNGVTALDSPLRVASERYSELLAEQVLAGVSIYRIARQLGVTHLAIRARLARHGYMAEVKGLPNNTRYGTRVHNRLARTAS